MNHEIVTMADGTEWDLVTDGGRFVILYPQDDDSQDQPLLGWHPDQIEPIKREEWKISD